MEGIPWMLNPAHETHTTRRKFGGNGTCPAVLPSTAPPQYGQALDFWK